MRLLSCAILFSAVVACDRIPAPTAPRAKEPDVAAGFASQPPNVRIADEDILLHCFGPWPSPLFVVDGVPLDTARTGLANLDPNEIETVTILKSVAASTVYGQRGANGAVLISTKHPPRIRSR